MPGNGSRTSLWSGSMMQLLHHGIPLGLALHETFDAVWP